MGELLFLAVDYWRVLRFPTLIVAACVVAATVYRNRRWLNARARSLVGRGEMPYHRCDGLLTNAEKDFYRQLRRVVPRGVSVAPKVRLADVITCGEADWRAFGTKIAQKHIDFVLFWEDSTEVLLAIELDDRSHERPERRRRDEFVDRALHGAGVPLLRVPVTRSFPRLMVERDVLRALEKHRARVEAESAPKVARSG